MKLRTYQAYTMAEALAAVKRDLGQTAVILHTRTFKRGGFLGIGRRTVVEVTATVGEEQRKTKAARQASVAGSPASVRARKAYEFNAPGSAAALSNDAEPSADDEPQSVTEEDRERTRRLAQALVEQHARRCQSEKQQPATTSTDQHTDSGADEDNGKLFSSSAPAVDSKKGDRASGAEKAPARTQRLTGTTRRFVLTPEPDEQDHEDGSDAAVEKRGNDHIQRNTRPFDRSAGHDSRPPRRDASADRQPVELFAEDAIEKAARSDDARAMQEELAAIREMVGQVLQRQVTHGPEGRTSQPTMPQQLFEMYLKLIGQDISEELADRIINDVRDELTGDELNNGEKLREALLRHLADYIPAAAQAVPQRSPDHRPLTIALVGPTGVGKTTTVAKLAASFKLRHNRKVGLITSDTYRIAAVDQLRTYANIIGLPLQVALTPREMEQCVHSLSDCDVILIDTAGRGQNDADRLAELRQFIDAADPHEVHLVLSGTASEKVLLREAEAFNEVGVDKIVLTKLDEAVSFGMLVGVIRQVGKELSFFTTGQEVPDHIEIGRPERLAELILGGKVHS